MSESSISTIQHLNTLPACMCVCNKYVSTDRTAWIRTAFSLKETSLVENWTCMVLSVLWRGCFLRRSQGQKSRPLASYCGNQEYRNKNKTQEEHAVCSLPLLVFLATPGFAGQLAFHYVRYERCLPLAVLPLQCISTNVAVLISTVKEHLVILITNFNNSASSISRSSPLLAFLMPPECWRLGCYFLKHPL